MKEITKIQNRNLFIQFNLNEIKNDERIIIKFERLNSAFREKKIFYSELEKIELNESAYMTSDKCINKIKEDKIIFNCNYSEYKVSKMKFLIFVNYESNIKISNFKETNENKKPEFNFIPLLIIVSVIIISIIVLLIIRKPKKNVFDNSFNEFEGLLRDK